MTARIDGKAIELSEGIGYFDRGEIRLDPTKSPWLSGPVGVGHIRCLEPGLALG